MDPATRSIHEAALTAIERRKLARGVALRPPEFGEALGTRARIATEQAAAAGWTGQLTQLAAHTSDDVLAVMRAAAAADQEARSRYQNWDALARQNQRANAHAAAGLPASFADSDATMAARSAIEPALAAADRADDALSALIKVHLKGLIDDTTDPVEP
jgi:hypothetical protein